MSILKQQFVILCGTTDISWQHEVVYYTTFFILDIVFMSEFLSYPGGYLFEDYWLLSIWTTVAGVEQNRYKTNNGCIKHLPQTGLLSVLNGFHRDTT